MADEKLKCENCEKVFKLMKSLKRHTVVHRGLYECVFCHKACQSKYDLFSHCITHINEKPHFCDVCDQTYADNSSLKTHIRTHSTERPF